MVLAVGGCRKVKEFFCFMRLLSRFLLHSQTQHLSSRTTKSSVGRVYIQLSSPRNSVSTHKDCKKEKNRKEKNLWSICSTPPLREPCYSGTNLQNHTCPCTTTNTILIIIDYRTFSSFSSDSCPTCPFPCQNSAKDGNGSGVRTILPKERI